MTRGLSSEAAVFRRAALADVPAIVAMLADDTLGASREIVSDPPLPAYVAAFHAIDADPNQLLVVAEASGEPVGCLQITFIAGLSRQGAMRGVIEAVRVRADLRGSGLGRRMVIWSIEQCRDRGCRMVQLTTDKTRTDAHRFYQSLGFTATHEGMKLAL